MECISHSGIPYLFLHVPLRAGVDCVEEKGRGEMSFWGWTFMLTVWSFVTALLILCIVLILKSKRLSYEETEEEEKINQKGNQKT